MRKKGGLPPTEWIEALKREYFALGSWWRAQKEELSQLDELEMSVLRIRLKHNGEDVAESEKLYVVDQASLPAMREDFEARRASARALCAKKVGQLFYLRSLKASDKSNDEGASGRIEQGNAGTEAKTTTSLGSEGQGDSDMKIESQSPMEVEENVTKEKSGLSALKLPPTITASFPSSSSLLPSSSALVVTPSYDCPICLAAISAKRSGMIVFTCGHLVCYKCGMDLLQFAQQGRRSNSERTPFGAKKDTSVRVQCPKCRVMTSENDLGYVERKADEAVDGKANQSESKDASFVSASTGMYGAKIQAVLTRMLRLRAKQPGVKVVVFSQWQEVLSLLADALQRHGLDYEMPKPSRHDFHRAIQRFKQPSKASAGGDLRRQRILARDGAKALGEAGTAAGCDALLLQLKSGGQGLNLTEATHVMFIDPSLNTAQHLQAAGRVHRIGQTKNTFVHWFVIKDSIEEKIYALHCKRRQDARVGTATAKEQDALSVADVGALLSARPCGHRL